MVDAEVAAMERTFDPGQCKGPEQPSSTGCYSISPRTPLDVQNCLCGRPASGTIGGQGQRQDSQAFEMTAISRATLYRQVEAERS